MKTILINGIDGFLGSELAKRFENNYNIIGLEFDSNNLYRIEDNRYKIYSSKDGITNKLFKKHNIYCIIHAATVYGRNNETDNEILFGNLYSSITFTKAIVNNCKIFINTDSVLDRFTSSHSLTKTHFLEWLKFYSKKMQLE